MGAVPTRIKAIYYNDTKRGDRPNTDEAVMVHVRVDSPVSRFYHGIAERRGRKAALVAVARKLTTVCYSVLVRGRPLPKCSLTLAKG